MSRMNVEILLTCLNILSYFVYVEGHMERVRVSFYGVISYVI